LETTLAKLPFENNLCKFEYESLEIIEIKNNDTMKLIKPILLCTTLLSLFTFSTCSLQNVMEVPETGENSFSCYINKEKFIPRTTNDIENIKSQVNHPLGIVVKNKSIEIIAANDYLYLVLFIKELGGEGSYALLQSAGFGVSDTLNNRSTLVYYENYHVPYRSSNPPPSGEINITELSNNNRHIKGTFNVTLYKETDPNDSIKITNGKFDVNLNTLGHVVEYN